MAHTITIQYLPGCPNRELAEARVEAALQHLGTPRPVVKVQEIRDETEANQVRFHGSPTILIDGIDAFAEESSPVGFACRLYSADGHIDGAPTVKQLVAAIETN